MPQPETPTRSRRGTAPPVDVDAYETAVGLLAITTPGLSPCGRLLRDRASGHLTARLYAELRGGRPDFSTEAVAIAVLKGAARELRTASSALHSAAERLRGAGDGFGANTAYRAHREADEAAESLDPS